MRPLPLKALRTFEAVARKGGFSRAAEELHVTQSAVSHQVNALEKWIGRPLFDRSGTRPRLLERGEILADTLSAAFATMGAACDRARAPAIEDKSLTIAVIPSVATCWLIPRLSAFRESHSETNLKIMYAIHGQPIDFDDAELVITYASQQPEIPGVVATRLFSGASAPVCSNAFCDAHAPLEEPQQFVAAGLLHDSDQSGWRQWLSKAGSTVADPPDGPVLQDFNLLRAAALAGQGIALCPLSIITDDLREGRLRVLSDETIHDNHAYYLLERHGRDGASAALVFRQWLLEQIRQQRQDGRDEKSDP